MRKEKFKILLSTLSIVALLLFAVGCTNENEGLTSGKAQIQFKLNLSFSTGQAFIFVCTSYSKKQQCHNGQCRQENFKFFFSHKI